MNKIYNFDEFLYENQQELPEDLMQQVKKYFRTGGKLWLDSEGRVCCSGKVSMKMMTTEKFPFQWGTITRSFDCSFCDNLTSLKGAPIEVGGDFLCYHCPSLISLEGAPKRVGGDFQCNKCPELTSLKGAPQEIKGAFLCYSCESLTSLKGAPKKVKGDFNCISCTNLTSLKDGPREVGGDFLVGNCLKLPQEEVTLAQSPELLKSWLKSGLDLDVWKKEKRGLIASKKFGF